MRSVKRVSSDHCRMLRNPWMLLEGYPTCFRSSKVPSTKPDTLKVLTANPRNSKNRAHFSRPPFCWTKLSSHFSAEHPTPDSRAMAAARLLFRSHSTCLRVSTPCLAPGHSPQAPTVHCPGRCPPPRQSHCATDAGRGNLVGKSIPFL